MHKNSIRPPSNDNIQTKTVKIDMTFSLFKVRDVTENNMKTRF